MALQEYFVYILTNKNNTVVYTGFSNDLSNRVIQHQEKVNKCFTSRYNINKLVYYETFDSPFDAIAREKQIKGYSRAKKNALINKNNPEWKDLIKKSSYINNR